MYFDKERGRWRERGQEHLEEEEETLAPPPTTMAIKKAEGPPYPGTVHSFAMGRLTTSSGNPKKEKGEQGSIHSKGDCNNVAEIEAESLLKIGLDKTGKQNEGAMCEQVAAGDGVAADTDSDGGETMESGLLLARVERGADLGAVATEDALPAGARRRPGVAVRVTFMFYGLAGNGQISAERVRRFAKQADFRRRELGLPHGSLVSGMGSWGGPENAPIKLFGFRLTDAVDGRRALQVITGVTATPMPCSLQDACRSLSGMVPGVEAAVEQALRAVKALCFGDLLGSSMNHDQAAALYLYTMEHKFYRQLNAAMRHEDRSLAMPFYAYLRLLFTVTEMLAKSRRAKAMSAPSQDLWRGVHLDLVDDHPEGCEVTWWGASSCTPKLTVARGFLGGSGPRTLFCVRHFSAVPIKDFSAFRGEEEWLLAPGTRLRVEAVARKSGGLTEIMLSELPPPRAIS